MRKLLRNGNLNTPEIFVVGGRGAPTHNKKNLVLFRRHSLVCAFVGSSPPEAENLQQ